jgi:acetyltransferase-like isoleucine patch superfamily enzyme
MIKSVGKHTYGVDALKFYVITSDKVDVNIGAFTSIADNVTIIESQGTGHFFKEGTTYPFGLRLHNIFDNYKRRESYEINLRDINIGNDVWIGSGVTIGPGSNIGDGAVIAFNSHVTGDVDPYAIYGGNPAKIIRYRFSEANIRRFLDLKWWELEDEQINEILPYLQQPPTSKIFIKINEILNR